MPNSNSEYSTGPLARQSSILDVLDVINERRDAQDLLSEYRRSFQTIEQEDSNPRPQDVNNRKSALVDSIHSHKMTESMRMEKDEHDMSRVTADAGINTFGCVFLEVWVLNKDRTRIVRRGVWMDSAFRLSLPDETLRKDAEYLVEEAPDTAIGEVVSIGLLTVYLHISF